MSDYIQDLTGFYAGNTVIYHDEVRVVTRPFEGTLPFLTLQAGDANEAVDVRECEPVETRDPAGNPAKVKP